MKIIYFTHSLQSCWNHGNAHFLRGILRDLSCRGHEVTALEPAEGWSRTHLLRDHGPAAIDAFRSAYPDLLPKTYDADDDPAELVSGADLVIVHEWNEPRLVAALARERIGGQRFTLLFHDTHHRAASDANAIGALDLDGFDGVLAFGHALCELYQRRGWGRRAFVWHEAADVTLFRPPAEETRRAGLVWIGNWGDGERSRELSEYLIEPAARARIPLDVYGVRYPREALAALKQNGATYRGWIANTRVPDVLARHLATVHVPRRPYTQALIGIPTIRMFEALACGIPIVCAPWQDAEHLFRPGIDYLTAASGRDMTRNLRALAADAALRKSLAANGLETIATRHTCAHRVDQLLAIVRAIAPMTTVELTA